MGRILEAAEVAVLKKCAEACEAALKDAVKDIEKDFKKKVFDQAVLDYYNDYPKPSIYKRRGGLYKAFKMSSTVTGQEASIMGSWDYNRLPQYKSNSKRHKSGPEWISRSDDKFNPQKSNNGKPEKGWILTNFFEGIHPRFYYTEDGLVNDSQYDTPSFIRIRDYKDDYIKNDYAQEILLKHLKKQVKKYM